jgi:hypothetical protein
MNGGQLYLAEVSWSARDTISDVAPGTHPVPVSLGIDGKSYQASIPSYSRRNGRDIQLAIKSQGPCAIKTPDGYEIPLAEYVDPDTKEHWWIEKNDWKGKRDRGFHDALSFRHPGGKIELLLAGNHCTVHMFYPGMSETEFVLLLDDLKSWCWRMAVDDSCYVTVDQQTEVKVLSPDFLMFASDFLRHAHAVLDLPNSELRSSVENQQIHRLRPNLESLRFLAQRGEQPMVPGRAAKHYYGTPENRLVHGMIKAVTRMLRPQEILAQSSSTRFRSTAKHYEIRAKDLREKTTERIDPEVLDENLRRAQMKRDEIQEILNRGYQKLKVTSERGYKSTSRIGSYNDTWTIVDLAVSNGSSDIDAFLNRHGAAMVIGHISADLANSQAGTQFYRCSVDSIEWIGVWRDYEKECQALESKRKTLEGMGWEQKLPPDVLVERRKEEQVLTKRAQTFRNAAEKTSIDEAAVAALLSKATRANNRAYSLGITPDTRFIPTMVFLQSPSYSGTLSAYRQLLELTGLDDTILDGLLALERIGIRDWPAIYERWSLVALLNVLQDDFRFVFEKEKVQENLLRYCTGQKTGHFTVKGIRADMNLSIDLSYQPILPNKRIPDFILAITDNETQSTTSIVIDAKSCEFIRRPPDASRNIFLYLDDCLHDLVVKKDYSQGGKHDVFVMHPTRKPCISNPTTMQSWAKESAYGGDSVFFWENEPPLHRHGAVRVSVGDFSNIKRLILMVIQYKLGRKDICASCGAGGDVVVKSSGKGVGSYYRCIKCNFLSVSSHCFNCKKSIVKNAAWWSYHDLHPTDVWNIKCPTCGSLL